MFRYEAGGAVEGQATVTVLWRDGSLEAVKQRPERPPVSHPAFEFPPCPPPPGGWRQVDGSQLSTALLSELKAAGLLVTVTMFGPSESKTHVITATDRDEVIRRIGPVLAHAVCVVQSRYSATRIAETYDHVLEHWDSWGCYRAGRRTDDKGQVTITVRVVRVLPELVEWMADIPKDLVQVDAWLDPTRAGAPVTLEL